MLMLMFLSTGSMRYDFCILSVVVFGRGRAEWGQPFSFGCSSSEDGLAHKMADIFVVKPRRIESSVIKTQAFRAPPRTNPQSRAKLVTVLLPCSTLQHSSPPSKEGLLVDPYSTEYKQYF